MLTSRLTVGLRLHECIQALLGGLSKQTCGAVRLITGLRHYSCAPEVHRFVEEDDGHTKFIQNLQCLGIACRSVEHGTSPACAIIERSELNPDYSISIHITHIYIVNTYR